MGATYLRVAIPCPTSKIGMTDMNNRYVETRFSREHRFSIGDDMKTGGHYLAIPVSNGVVDYDEQYHITPEQYRLFLADMTAAVSFVEECRRRGHDDQLIYPPSERRGEPI